MGLPLRQRLTHPGCAHPRALRSNCAEGWGRISLAVGARHGCVAIEAAQARALRRIIEGERVPASQPPVVVLPGQPHWLPRLVWSDVLVSRRYEAACRQLLRSGLFEPTAPATLFDGRSFHSLCAVERQMPMAMPSSSESRNARAAAQGDSSSPREPLPTALPPLPLPLPPLPPLLPPDPTSLPLPPSHLLSPRTRRSASRATQASIPSPAILSSSRAADEQSAAEATAAAEAEMWAESARCLHSASYAAASPLSPISPQLMPLQAMKRTPQISTAVRSSKASNPSSSNGGGGGIGRRRGFGPCAQCGKRRRGEHADDEDGAPLYCLVCWGEYEEYWGLDSGSSEPLHTEVGAASAATAPAATATAPYAPSLATSSAHLPVDAFEEEIVRLVATHRVTVITGETGCGKSSRVPMMLMQQPLPAPLGQRKGASVIFVAQPRRIAAYSLYKRAVATGHGDLVGLRMGQDTREEGPRTRLFYVTTGYLARLASYHPEAFERVSHLILDECHERSIEADVLCLMARRLLRRFRGLKVVLMSATVHTELYRDYFVQRLQPSAVSLPLHVGGARFPITVHYLDALGEMGAMPDRLRRSAETLASRIDRLATLGPADIRSSHSSTLAGSQLELAVYDGAARTHAHSSQARISLSARAASAEARRLPR